MVIKKVKLHRPITNFNFNLMLNDIFCHKQLTNLLQFTINVKKNP